MSLANAVSPESPELEAQQSATQDPHLTQGDESLPIGDVLEQVEGKIAPVWPLKDYVAVNPYAGLSGQKFLSARNSLQTVSDLELLMSADYYREQFEQGAFCRANIDAAVDELVADGVAGAERIDVNQVVAFLKKPSGPSPTSDMKFNKSVNSSRQLCTLAEKLDRYAGSDWSRLICDEVSKHCAAHYDQGQATWSSPWRELPLYQAWRSAALHDRSFEILGVGGFRNFVSQLPHDPQAALLGLLTQMGVPQKLWADFLLCLTLAMPGWSAWTKYQQRHAALCDEECTDFAGLLAIRLAYEVALSRHCNFHIDWHSVAEHHALHAGEDGQPNDEDLLRYALLKASEIAFRKQMIADISDNANEQPRQNAATDRLAQMVFCIDVRSERIRRQLEAASSKIETFGFAGFFGLPIEFVRLSEEEGSAQVPVLIDPQLKVYEELDTSDHAKNQSASTKRLTLRFLRKAWKQFQASAVSAFSFVETTGLLYGLHLISRSLGQRAAWQSQFDGVSQADRKRLAPSLRGLNEQGVGPTQQAVLAESMLRGIGILDDFAPLVVFCGHGSQTENNPLKAGLDCGACGGHSGEPNARLAAKLLNQPSVRHALAERGVEIPDATWFVAALHNTTTDELEFFDLHELPASHHGDLEALETHARSATLQTGQERLSVLPGVSVDDLDRRSRDWSEVRPEWGLAGNAAFIAAPRRWTTGVSLEGRAFLHSYDHRRDPGYAVLEQIMTAPLVVANWINMQYYASTVDPIHFGSGNKTVHNVVGRFGILSGNGGDLMTGLPWQSIHDGVHYQHHPLRLLAVIAAPRHAIEAVAARHEGVASLLTNGWLQLIAHDDDRFYRYTELQQWDELSTSPVPMATS